ncbi:MAG: glycosyltransferase family 4 protein [Calditrichaeota bacterium]|nr:glycosyltransferase family 4 protein [Calditrichota bacterium]
MKICIDARVVINEKTGIGNYTYNLIKSLLQIDRKNEYLIYVFSGLAESHPLQKLEYENLSKRIISLRPVTSKQQIAVRKLLAHDSPDVYHYPNWDVPIFQNVKTIFTIHDLTYLLHKNFYAKHSRLKEIYTFLNIKYGIKKAEKIISVSQTTKDDLQKLFEISDSKVKVINEAFEEKFLERFTVGHQKKVLSAFGIGEKYFLFVGERRPHKNLPRIIEAFQKFQQKNRDYSLVIIGKSYAQYKEDLKTIERLKLGKNVVVLNYVKDEFMPVLFQAAEAFVFASLYEGFGIPVLEAMASETPVITSNISATNEISGDAAIKVNPYNAKNIADAMNRITKDESLRKNLVERGKKRVKQFSWEKTAQQTLLLYEEIAKK